MCGIAGLNFNNKDLILRMCNRLRHRGPDDMGFYCNDVSIGNVRLSIIGLSSGAQPIHNEDKTIWITYNGEIYNFHSIRDELIKLGHKFYTDCDTEVIVHAYEEWGFDCLKRFNGMFGFALYDKRKKLLFIARDRFGVKPLYYYFRKGKMRFASEIKALFEDPDVPRLPNDKVILRYIVNGEIPENREETFFRDIKKLLSSHYMIVYKDRIEIKRWYSIREAAERKDVKLPKSNEEYINTFRSLLEDAVRYRLISEVSVGTCLSGGIDSSSILCIMQRFLTREMRGKKELGKRIKSFSAVYEDSTVDERGYISESLKKTGAEANWVFPNSQKLLDELPKLIYFQDEPVGSSSVFAQWEVMRLASNKVKVLLDGQGSDETLAGYPVYYLYYLRDLFRCRLYGLFLLEVCRGYRQLFYLAVEKIKMILEHKFIVRIIRGAGSVGTSSRPGTLQGRLLYDVENTLPVVLRYEDKNSMAFSIESRTPFLDYRLVEFAFKTPGFLKMHQGYNKWILRKAMNGLVPSKILKNRRKVGFDTPEADWLRTNAQKIRAIFASEFFGKRSFHFKQGEVLIAFDEFINSKFKDYLSRIFWRFLCLEVWYSVFIDNPSPFIYERQEKKI